MTSAEVIKNVYIYINTLIHIYIYIYTVFSNIYNICNVYYI